MLKHYNGSLGEFDYDDSIFKVEKDTIGNNGYILVCKNKDIVDARNIEIPQGLTKCIAMFEDCKKLLYPPRYIPTSVRTCNSMFYGCSNLMEAPIIPDMVENCRYMFSGCKALVTLKQDTLPANAEDVSYMFEGCPKFTQQFVIPEKCLPILQGFDKKNIKKANGFKLQRKEETKFHVTRNKSEKSYMKDKIKQVNNITIYRYTDLVSGDFIYHAISPNSEIIYKSLNFNEIYSYCKTNHKYLKRGLQ